MDRRDDHSGLRPGAVGVPVQKTGEGSPMFGGRTRKISVSMPEELSAAVQERVGRGGVSHYVTEAVAKQLELDLLAELAEQLEEEHGPVSEEALAEAESVWPDVD